jgi:hypothetical protein
MALHVPSKQKALVDTNTGAPTDVWLSFFQVLGSTYGTWKAVPYAAGHYSASGAMTWTVQDADQITFAYVLMSKLLLVAFTIRAAAVGGVADASLKIALPGVDANGNAIMAARDMSNPVWISDNGTKAIGRAFVAAGDTAISIQRVDGSNWSAGANGVEGQIALEVQ